MKYYLQRLIIAFAMLGHYYAFAQITISGGTSAVGSYTTLSAAITALNNGGAIFGSVTIDVSAGHSETLTNKIIMTATGDATNSITIQKAGAGANPKLIAYVGTVLTPSSIADGFFALSGSDYVTIDGIDLEEKTTGTLNPTTLMEFGYGLFKASATNGCQNNTIKNCTITLNRLQNTAWTAAGHNGSIGIIASNATTAATPSLTITDLNGSNSFNRFYSNTIQNCNAGIVLVGFAAATPYVNSNGGFGDTANDIGGTSAATGNSILNFGGGATTNPATGIFATSQWDLNVSNNIINNNNGSGVNHATTLRGIFLNSSSPAASSTCNGNTITLTSAATTNDLSFIEHSFGAFTTGFSNIATFRNNTLSGTYPTATTGAMRGIYINGVAPATVNIENNTISNWSYSASALTGTGLVYGIHQTTSNANSTFNVNGNLISNITRIGTTGGTTAGMFINTGTAGMRFNVKSNTVSNLSIDGAGTSSTMYGIHLGTGIVVADSNNINNIRCIKTTGTSLLYGLSSTASPTDENYNYNTIHTIIHNGTGVCYGFITNTAAGQRKVSYNTVYNVQGAGTTVAGMFMALSSPSIFGNKIYDISSTSTGAPTVSGLLLSSVSTGTTNGNTATATVYNNVIGDIKAPNATSTAQTAPVVRGINLTATTTVSNFNLFHNTVYLNASTTGSNFATAGLFITGSTTATTSNVTLQNNIIVNNSTPAAGVHATVAYQRGTAALDNYNAASNNNLFYAGTSGAKNLIYNDGTNSDISLATFTARMATRDQNSITEDIASKFLSTAGSSSSYLRINATIPTQLEGGGGVSPILVDIDGDSRNSPPDIGADEFNGLTLQPPTIANINITPTTSQCASVPHPVTVDVTPGISTTITDVRLNFAFNGVLQTPISMTLTSGSNSALGTYAATIPVATPTNAVVTWFIEAFAGNLSRTAIGTTYQDDLNLGSAVLIDANPSTICQGSSSSLSFKVQRIGTATVGNTLGTAITTTGTPYRTGSVAGNQLRNQYLVLASEMTAAGFGPGDITALGFRVTTAAPTGVMTNNTFRMANVTATALTATYLTPNFTTVLTLPSYTPINGLNTHTFTTPFLWDGTSNILIEICGTLGATGGGTSLVTSTTPGGITATIANSVVNGCSATGSATVLTNQRPQLSITGNLSAPPTNFIWSTGETTDVISVSPSATTNYMVTTTVNNCQLVSAPFTVNVTPLPAAVTASPASAHCGSQIPTVSISSNSGAATPIYKWYSAPTGGTLLQENTSATFLSVISTTTTFHVSELLNGCESIRVPATVNVTQPDAISFVAPTAICEGTSLNFSITKVGNNNNYVYTWGATPTSGSGLTGTPTGSTQTFTPSIGTFVYGVTATDASLGCVTSHTKEVNVFPLLSGTAEVAAVTNICPGVGTVAANVNGVATVINNDFSNSTLPSNMTSAGNDFAIASGQMRINSATASRNGGVLITNPTNISSNEIQIDFDLITTPGSAAPADGISYSYGPDVVALPTGLGSTVINTVVAPNTTNPENGSGTALKLAFDAFTNGANNAGVYLMYNCPRWNQSSTLTAADGLIFYSNSTEWRATQTSGRNTHVTIRINNAGELSMWLNNVQVVNNQPLPADYLTANKSTWRHAFAGRSGAEFQGQFIDNLIIQYNGFYEYSLNGTNWTSTTPIQAVPGNYNVSARYINVPTCSANLGNVTVNPVSLVASANRTSLCIGQSTQVSVTPSAFINGTYQWQERAAGTSNPFTDIAGATGNTFNATITTTSELRCVVDCGGGATFASNIITINALDPQITSTTNGSRCGTGTVVLSANATLGDSIRWYDAQGKYVTKTASGGSFTTPVISNSTNYQVEAYSNSTLLNVGRQTNTALGSAVNLTNYGLQFTITEPIILNSVDVFAGTGTAITIELRDVAFTTSLFSTGSVTTTPNSKNTISLGWVLSPGTYRLGETAMTGTFFREGGSGVTYPYPIGSNGNITGYFFNTGAQTTTSTTTYYYFYNWVVTTGCISPRQTVTATVNTPPAFTITDNKTVCNGATEQLQVTSNLADYDNYTWTSVAPLFSDAAATTAYTSGTNTNTVYLKSTTAGSTRIVGFASNSQTGCQNTDTTTFIVMPLPLIKGSPDNICGTIGDVTLSLTPSSGYGLGGFQWYQSSNGINFTPLSSATTSTYAANSVTATDYYRMELKDELGNICATQPADFTLNVFDPQVQSTTPGTRCGTGSVVLSATGTAGATMNWYSSPNGGTSIGTGNTFNTPAISNTTDFYVAASQGLAIANTAMPNAITATTTGVGTTNFGLVFNALSTFRLKSVKIYPVSSTNASGTITVDVVDGNNQVIQTKTLNITGSPTPNPTPVVLDLDFTIPAGTNYKLRPGAFTGITSLLFETSAGAPNGNYGYPYTIGGVVTILTSTLTASPTNTARNDLYYYFYDWQVVTSCESARTAVTATVTPSPSFAITSDKSVCNNGILPLTVTNGLANYDTFTWAPQTNLFTDAAATTPYTGGNAATVYFKTATAGNYVINAVSNSTVSQCANIDDITVTNLSVPTLSSSRQELCLSGVADLSLSPNNGYTNASFEWYSNNSLITGANSSLYSTGTITTTTLYKAKVFDSQTSLCGEPEFNLIVNTPSVANTTPNAACPGNTVTLSATASGLGNLKWYDVATGGTALGTGNTYTTPALTTTKTYYVESVEGGGGIQNVGPTAITGASTVVASYFMNFTVQSALTINSVKCYFNAVGTNFTLLIRNATGGTPVFSYSGVTTTSGTTTPQTLPINAVLQPGNYQMGWTTDPGTFRQSTGATYPYTIPGLISITGNTFNDPNYFYYFYDWSISSGCTSPRVPVVATINSCPQVSAKVFLNNVNPSTGLMNDYMRTLSNFPTSDPYTNTFSGSFTHVNSGPVASTTPTVLNVQGNNAIVDWVFLELRQGTSPSTTVIATKAGLLQKDGDIVGMNGSSPIEFNAPAGNYYVGVRHRNHTGFRTENTIALNSTSTSLNFTNNSVALYGAFPLNAISASVSVMNGGDANSDGSIDAFDTITWEFENGLFDDYFLNSDYNMDGSVDAFDSIEWEFNNGKYQELD
jgi:hypothetical protein